MNDQVTLSGATLGAVIGNSETVFRVFVLDANEVEVVIYDDAFGVRGRRSVPMTRGEGDIWEVAVPENLAGRYYRFQIVRENGEALETNDPWAVCNSGYAHPSLILDPRSVDPEGFRPIVRPETIRYPTDAVIWEVSLRDLTIDSSSGVPAEQRGRFLGVHTGTTVPGTDRPTGLDYLKYLGVTHVQILPIQDFDDSEKERGYNWGYMPKNFFSPDGWFATDRRNDSRVREAKEAIRAFHEAGILVVLDVVYNHTGTEAPLSPLAPGYYHRHAEDGSYLNGSGAGNELRTEAPMVRRMILESLRYWVEEFGVDGFRFDLMGLIDRETLVLIEQELRAIYPTIMLYGEPWVAGNCGLEYISDKEALRGTGLGCFNDDFRNAVKGPPNGPEPGFIMNGSSRDAVKAGLEGSIHSWADTPTRAVNYLAVHDNLTLWDKTLASAPDIAPEDRLKMNTLGIGILLLAQGVPVMHGGMEFAYTKHGDENSYCSPDTINSLKWDRQMEFAPMVEYTRGLIAMRRAHPVFRLPSREEIEKRLHFLDDRCPNDRAIVMELDGDGLEGETWKQTLVLINGSHDAAEFSLPDGEWKVYLRDLHVAGDEAETAQGTLVLGSRSVAVLSQA